MKFTQRPKIAPVPAAPMAETAPVAQAVAPPAVPPPAAAPESAPDRPQPVTPKSNPAPVVRMTHHSQPMRRALPPPVVVAQNAPPAEPEAPPEPPAPAPMQAEPAPTNEPAPPVEPAQPAEAAAAPPEPQPAPTVTLPVGMTLPVRLGENLSSDHNQAGDTFTATLDAPVTAGGFVIAEKGARVEGRVIEAQKKGKAVLGLELTKLVTSDGQHVAIKTAIFRKQSETMATGDQVGIVAAAAGIGAIIGAMAGGGKGAAIGAGAGGAAGGGGVVAARDKAVSLQTESKITFRLGAPVTLTEQR